MISDALQKWIVVIIIILGAVCSQMPMMMPYPMGGYGPMMMPPPPPPMPMPMPVPVPVPIAIPYQESTTTTTTTTAAPHGSNNGDNNGNEINIAIPVPVPQFVQIAVPGFDPQICQKDNKNGKNGNGNKNCPPCPPCSCSPCTPAFFSYCSPCHQQCRCKSAQDTPHPQDPQAPRPLPGPAFPIPIPMPPPPPVVIVPFPPQFTEQKIQETRSSECNSNHASLSCSGEDGSSSCDGGSRRSKKKKRKKNRGKGKNRKKSKYDIYRRNNYGYMKRSRGDPGLVKPVLTYMSRDGEIKMKRRLSNDEANLLLGESDQYQNVRLMAGEDSNNRPRVVVMSEPNMRNGHRRRQILLQGGSSQHMLGNGRKELVFRPPQNRKISNLSVSFQIAR